MMMQIVGSWQAFPESTTPTMAAVRGWLPSKDNFTRLSFTRFTGVCSPKNTLWTIGLAPEDGVDPKKLWSTNLRMTEGDYFRDQLYRNYLQGTKEGACQSATGVGSNAEGKADTKYSKSHK